MLPEYLFSHTTMVIAQWAIASISALYTVTMYQADTETKSLSCNALRIHHGAVIVLFDLLTIMFFR